MDSLQSLIRTFSKSEKRSFKLLSKAQQGDKAYLQLFDAIDRGLKPPATLSKGNHAFLKHYLQTQLLNTLRSIYAGSTDSIALANRIIEIELLVQRKQYKLAQKLLVKAERQALDSENYLVLLQLLPWERQISKSLDPANDEECRTAIRERRLRYTALNEEIDRFQDIYEELYTEQMTHGFAMTKAARARYEKLVAVISAEPAPESFKARVFSHLTFTRYHQALREIRTASQYSAKATQLFEKNAKTGEHFQWLKKLSYALHSFNLAQLDQVDEALRACKVFRSLCSDSPADPYYITLLLIEFTLAHNARRYEQLHSLRAPLEAAYNAAQNPVYKASMCYAISNIDVIDGNLTRALEWLNIITSETRHRAFESIYISARGSQLLIHYELGNHDYLKYAIRAHRQFLRRLGQLAPFTDRVLVHLQRGAGATKGDYEKLKSDLSEITIADSTNKVIETTDVRIWLESKLQGISMKEAFKQEA